MLKTGSLANLPNALLELLQDRLSHYHQLASLKHLQLKDVGDQLLRSQDRKEHPSQLFY